MIEQGKVLADVYRSGGEPALDDAIADTMSYADPQTAVALLDADGRETVGNLDTVPPVSSRCRKGYRNALVRLRGQTDAARSGVGRASAGGRANG